MLCEELGQTAAGAARSQGRGDKLLAARAVHRQGCMEKSLLVSSRAEGTEADEKRTRSTCLCGYGTIGPHQKWPVSATARYF